MTKFSHTGFWQRFRQNKLALVAVWILALWVFFALFANLIANPYPLKCDFNGETIYPAFQLDRLETSLNPRNPVRYQYLIWDTLKLENATWALIPYGNQERADHRFFAPFAEQIPKGSAEALSGRKYHWLGTDREGRDLLAMLILGSRVSLGIALLAVLIIAGLGFLFGGIAGFIGDAGWQWTRGVVFMSLLSLPFAWFYAFQVRYYQIVGQDGPMMILQVLFSFLLFLAIVGAFVWLGRKLSRWAWWAKPLYIPLDLLLMKVIEIRESLPVFLLVISLTLLFGRSIWFVILVMGLLGWTGVARMIRGELLRVRQAPYISAARGLGLPAWRIIWRHALPNAFPPVLIGLVLAMGSVILSEATLAFLGLIDQSVSWGSLLSSAREDGFQYWWIIVFPGLLIFLIVISLNIVGERLRDLFDPRTNE